MDLLKSWNGKINLVGRGAPETWWVRHFEDSLQLAPLFPENDGPHVDIGSGGGFPGIVLAAMRDSPTHLIESDQRKCAFLHEATRVMALTNVTVHAKRITDVSLPPMATMTARAFAPLPSLLTHAHRMLAPGGVAIFPKGRFAEAELTEAATHWHMSTERFASRTDPEATIFRIRDIRPA